MKIKKQLVVQIKRVLSTILQIPKTFRQQKRQKRQKHTANMVKDYHTGSTTEVFMVKVIDGDRLKIVENLTIKDNANLVLIFCNYSGFLIDTIRMLNYFHNFTNFITGYRL